MGSTPIIEPNFCLLILNHRRALRSIYKVPHNVEFKTAIEFGKAPRVDIHINLSNKTTRSAIVRSTTINIADPASKRQLESFFSREYRYIKKHKYDLIWGL